MNPFDAVRDEVARLRREVRESRTTLRLGTVTASLEVSLTDGSTVAPAGSTVALVDGDRVLVASHGRRVYVVGVLQ